MPGLGFGMRRFQTALLAMLTLGPAVFIIHGEAYVGAPDPPYERDPKRIEIVFTNPVPADINTRIIANGGTLVATIPSISTVIAENGPPKGQSEFMTALATYPDTQAVFADPIMHLAYTPNDPDYNSGRQVGINITGTYLAWDSTRGSQ